MPLNKLWVDDSREKAAQEKAKSRRLLFVWVPIGFCAGIIGGLVTGGKAFLPVWGLVVLGAYLLDGSGEDDSG